MQMIQRHPFHSLRAARIAVGTFLIVASIVTKLDAQDLSASQVKILKTIDATSSVPAADAEKEQFSYAVNPNTQQFIVGVVLYYSNTCMFFGGTWAVTSPPKYGNTSTSIHSSSPGDGSCPGLLLPFDTIYYTWTSRDPTKARDSFAATWTSSNGSQFQITVGITLIRPVGFKQKGLGTAMPGGVLHFDYVWNSTSGNVADLTQCEVGENVDYPSAASPFLWPEPPYFGSTPNPDVNWVPATDGKAEDNHSPKTFDRPYVANAFTAIQSYRFRCRDLNIVNFSGWSRIALVRKVSDSTGKGCWGYTIKKSGSSASIFPLPGVKPVSCKTKADNKDALDLPVFGGRQDRSSFSVSLPEVSVGLHEPIFSDLIAFNQGAQPVELDLGLNKKSNLEIKIWGPGDVTITKRLSSEGFGSSGKILVPPGGEYTKSLLLNEWYDFPQVGIYRIRITLLDNADRPSVEFSVEIGPRDPKKLERVAQDLAERAIEGPLAESMEAANALSHIKDTAAIESLARILQHGSFVEQYAVEGLGLIDSPEAIAVLEAAQDHPDEEVRMAVRVMLEHLRNQTP